MSQLQNAMAIRPTTRRSEMSTTAITAKSGNQQLAKTAEPNKALEAIKSYVAKPWDKWTYEEMAAAVLTANGQDERKDEISEHAGRTIRAAFRGYKDKTFTDLDFAYMQQVIEFERAFTLKSRPKREKAKMEKPKADVPAPPAPGKEMVKA